MPTDNQLPPRENALFKRIVKCYEQKQYTKGLKMSKTILSVPNLSEHGETLAMRGLILNCLGRKDEAYDHVRRGLRNDLKSHVCWHVYGLLQRSDRKYDEAIKCYRNALKWDKDNLQILRDLSMLQVQMRDLEGYRDTRYQLLLLRPTQRMSWIGYAMAYHLLKEYDMALKILNEFCKTQQPKPYDYEHSELVLYIYLVLRESGQLQEAMDHLVKHDKDIVDRLSLCETKAELCVSLGKQRDAVSLYMSLIDRNPENTTHYANLIAASNLDTEADKLRLFQDFAEKYPRASAPKRLPLSIASGSAFIKLADSYLRHSLHKGMPATFVTVKPLYQDSEKVKMLEKLVLDYEKNLKECQQFDCTVQNHEDIQPPTALLWTYYYLAQHFSHLGQHTRALDYVNTAIEHTPLLIELHTLKAKIFKRSGDLEQAALNIEEAQSLDTADRYINSKCAKYLLRLCQIQRASDMCAKFSREGVSTLDNLKEMQCMWFETECALAYQKLGRWGEALKKCIEIDRHFTEITEDQFDFHTYCMRKITLRAYVSLLRLEDILRSHPFYFKAATIAIEIYLHLYDNPHSQDSLDGVGDIDNMTAAEIKKLKNKERKARKKKAIEMERQAEQEKKEQQSKPKGADGDLDGPKEEQLNPEELVKVKDPLAHAIKFLTPLQSLASDRIETHILAYEIYSRKGRLLLMLQCIKRGCRADLNDNPKFHMCKVHFLQLVNKRSNVDATMTSVFEQEMSPLYSGKDARTLNEEFLQRNLNSLPHRLSAAVVMVELDISSQKRALSLLTELSDDMRGLTIQTMGQVLDLLTRKTFGNDEDAAESYRTKCLAHFPYATSFTSNAPQEQIKRLNDILIRTNKLDISEMKEVIENGPVIK